MYPHDTTRRKYSTIADCFWTHCLKGNPDECWSWKAAIHKGGYGQLTYSKRSQLAHRVSWQIHNGPIPRGLFVLHRCDNPICTNPNHLFLGTQADNMADMHRKGRDRQGVLRGELNSKSKLTEEQVVAIRQEYTKGKRVKDLMREYNLSKSAIEHVVARRSWSHVP